MEFLERLRDTIHSLEERDFYKYLAAFFGGICLLLGLLIYIHYRKVSRYTEELKTVDSARNQTKKILSDFRVVTQQKHQVESILSENENFLIGDAFQSIVQRLGLKPYLSESTTPATGEPVSGLTEVHISAHFASITMKQLTDLLSAIAQVPQLYTKDLTIKRSARGRSVDVDINVGTLEPPRGE
jgi:hypothetical protein